MRKKGVLKAWNEARGFGFISVTEGTRFLRFFLHTSQIRSGTQSPVIGQEIEFEVSDQLVEKGRQPQAIEADVILPETGLAAQPADATDVKDGARE